MQSSRSIVVNELSSNTLNTVLRGTNNKRTHQQRKRQHMTTQIQAHVPMLYWTLVVTCWLQCGHTTFTGSWLPAPGCAFCGTTTSWACVTTGAPPPACDTISANTHSDTLASSCGHRSIARQECSENTTFSNCTNMSNNTYMADDLHLPPLVLLWEPSPIRNVNLHLRNGIYPVSNTCTSYEYNYFSIYLNDIWKYEYNGLLIAFPDDLILLGPSRNCFQADINNNKLG